MQKFALVALVAALFAVLPAPAGAQSPVTVTTAAELEAAVAAAAGSTSSVDIRIKAGTYALQSLLELRVAAGATATLRNFGDGEVILTIADADILRTGFITRTGSYVIKGLTFAGSSTAITHYAGDIRIENSTFIDNLQAFYADSSGADITILNSTFWENGTRCGEGSWNCGAIWLDFYGSATLTNLTVGGAGNGVGIFGLGNESVGPTTLTNVIFLTNQWNCRDGAPGAVANNNIVDDAGSGCPGSTVASQGFHVTGFGDNGGVVRTWPLSYHIDPMLPPNPAIQGGDPARCPSHDGRGAIRRATCDVGAYETTPRGFTLESATGAGEVTIETAPGAAAFANFHAIDPSTLPQTGLPPGVTFPFGVFAWQAILTPGPDLPVAITFPTAISSPVHYWKFSPLAGQWYDLCARITCSLSANQRTLSFTISDGGAGDSDLALGIITDPGGLGVDGNGPAPPNMAISKSIAPGSPAAGGTANNGDAVHYRLALTNHGGPTTASVEVTDTLDSRLSFVAAGSDPRCTPVGRVITCAIPGIVPAGASDSFDIAVQVAANAAPAGGSTHVANFAAVLTQGDADPSDDISNVVTLTVNGPVAPNISLTKSFAPGSVAATGAASNGDAFSYRLVVANQGNGPTTAPLVVSDLLDPRLTFVAAGSDPRCVGVGQQVTCTAAALAAGASGSFDIAVQVAANAAPANGAVHLDNTARVSTAGDTNAADDQSTVTLIVHGPQQPNGMLSQGILSNGVLNPSPIVNNGDTLILRLSVTTTGPVGLLSIRITDTLDPRLTFLPLSSDPRCSAVGQTVTCTEPNSGGGDVFDIQLRLSESAAAPGVGSVQILNTAVLSIPNDSNAADDASTLVLTVLRPPAPDMAIAKQFVVAGTVVGHQLTVDNGAEVVYRLRATNVGAGPTAGLVTVTDTLDPRLLFIGGRSDSRCSATGQVIACVPGAFGPGHSEVFDIGVQAVTSVEPLGNNYVIANTAAVSTPFDAEPANNASNTALLTVAAYPPNLQLQKRVLVDGQASLGPVTIPQGSTGTYRLQVLNAGHGAATGPTVVTDTLHPALSFVAAGSDARCRATGQVVTCTAANPIFANGSESFDVAVYVGGNILVTGSPIHILNSATVSTPFDAVQGDNDSNTVTVVVRLGAPTPLGTTTVQATDDIGMPQPVSLSFSNVTGEGFTTATPLTGGPALPSHYLLRGQIYDITTTAQYQGTITVCFFGGSFLTSDRLLHHDNGLWVELPGQQLLPSGGPFTHICADTTSLSPFAVGRLNTPPTLTLPGDITTEATSAAGATVTFAAAAVDAEDGPLTPTCTPGSGSLFPNGVTTVTCTATDADGAAASGTFTVTVVPGEEHSRAPTLARIAPEAARRGTLQVVFLHGTGLRTNLKVRFSGGDITVIEDVSINATTAAVLIYIKPHAARGPRTVTASTAFGTSNALTFVVR